MMPALPSRRRVLVAAVGVLLVGGLLAVPYALSSPFENETLHADAAARATYAVGLDARRVSGTDVSPC